MSTSDGANTETIKIQSVTDKVFKRRVSDENIEYLASKFGFRGFEKLPMVVLPRYDITPYIHHANNSNNSDGPCVKDFRELFLHACRFTQKCTVKLVKDDLDALRRASQRQEPSNDSSDSDSDMDPALAPLKCKICEKGYSSEKKLQKHEMNKHIIVYKKDKKPPKRVSFSNHITIHELTQFYKCRKCFKVFQNYRILRRHMKQDHKKRKCYICHYCDRKFVERIFFKIHVRIHCDVCGKLLPNKFKLADHKRNVCRVLKLYKCKTCKESFFKFMDLTDHNYEHTSTSYICDVCKDQFPTKCGVAHHISFLHSKQRPTSLYNMLNLGTERLYLCNFCDESSVDRNIIENHTQLLPDLTNRAMTGYKDYYFCDQCLKKFDTETDMLQHKWTHFLKDSDDHQAPNESSLAKKKSPKDSGNHQLPTKSILVKQKSPEDSDNHQSPTKSILAKQKSPVKTTYSIDEKIPEYMKPVVILKKITIPDKVVQENTPSEDEKSADVNDTVMKKVIVHPKSRKTLVSNFQCQNCAKYFSSNYCLNRHIETLHSDYDSLRCKVCEETFVWPSLLRSHKCIRLQHPEMPFDDARPEIHFDNVHEITPIGFDDLVINENDDYMNTIDFEIPAPIVKLTEYDGFNASQDKSIGVGYKLIMQEVPIEF